MKHWHRKEIPDDPNRHLGIKKNYVSFAGMLIADKPEIKSP